MNIVLDKATDCKDGSDLGMVVRAFMLIPLHRRCCSRLQACVHTRKSACLSYGLLPIFVQVLLRFQSRGVGATCPQSAFTSVWVISGICVGYSRQQY